MVSIKKEKLWCLDFGKEGDVIRYLANDNEFHGEKSKWVLEEELFVTDESVPLVDERIQRNNHPFAKPIFQKDGELSYDYLVIEPQKWDGFLPVAKVLGRDEFKTYMGVNEVRKGSIKDLDSLRDQGELSILRRDNDFADEMDDLGLDPKNTMAIHVLHDHLLLSEEEGLIIDKNQNALNVNGEKVNLTVHAIKHESLDKLIYLIDKEELFALRDEKETEKKIFVGYGDVYLLEGLELDVESDFFSSEYLSGESIDDLEVYIDEQGINPIWSKDGYIEAPGDDVVIYLADEGSLDYASSFQKNNQVKKELKELEVYMTL